MQLGGAGALLGLPGSVQMQVLEVGADVWGKCGAQAFLRCAGTRRGAAGASPFTLLTLLLPKLSQALIQCASTHRGEAGVSVPTLLAQQQQQQQQRRASCIAAASAVLSRLHALLVPSSQLEKLLALANALPDNHSEGCCHYEGCCAAAGSLGGCKNRRKVSMSKGGGATLLLLAASCACGTDILEGGAKKSAVGGAKNGETESDGGSGGCIRKEGVAVSW